MQAHQGGDLTQAEKVRLARRALRKRGVARSWAEPPLYRLLWKVGIAATPPLFLPLWKLLLVFGLPFGLFFAAFSAVFSGWSTIGLLIGVPLGSLFYGLGMGAYVRSKALTLELPRWKEYPPATERS